MVSHSSNYHPADVLAGIVNIEYGVKRMNEGESMQKILCEGIYKTKHAYLRRVPENDVKVVIVMSIGDSRALFNEISGYLIHRSKDDENITFMGCEIMRSGDAKDGEIKFLVNPDLSMG